MVATGRHIVVAYIQPAASQSELNRVLVSSFRTDCSSALTLSPCDCTNATALITIGQLTFSGACVKNSTQVLHLEITSSVDHSAYADLTQAGAGGTFGNGNMAAGQRNLLANVSTQNVPSAIFTPVTGEALSADGHQVFYDLYMGQNVGSVNDGTCVFGGSFAVN